MENLFCKILKIAEAMLKLVGVIITFEVIAFPAHDLEIVTVKHPLWATSFVQFVIKTNVMRMKVEVPNSIDNLIALFV